MISSPTINFYKIYRKPRVSILCQKQARAVKIIWKTASWGRQIMSIKASFPFVASLKLSRDHIY